MRTTLTALLMTLATQVGTDPFTVNGDAVVYDTVNSEGGYLEAGYDIADIVIDAELDTHVDNVCESAYANIF